MMKIYRGIDNNGDSIVFVDGEESIAKAIESYTDSKLGEPKAETIACQIAEIDSISINSIDDGDEMVVGEISKSDEQPMAKKEIVDFNSSLLKSDNLCWMEKEGELGVATSIVMEPNDGDGDTELKPDTQGEIFSKSVVRDTAFDWLSNGGAIDFMHSFQSLHKEDAHVVESWLTRGAYTHGEYECNDGTWMMSAKFDTDSDYWKGIKDGKFRAWSPGGIAKKVPVEE